MTQIKRKRLNLAVPISLHKILKDECSYTGQTLNSLILQIFWEWAKKTGKLDKHGNIRSK